VLSNDSGSACGLSIGSQGATSVLMVEGGLLPAAYDIVQEADYTFAITSAGAGVVVPTIAGAPGLNTVGQLGRTLSFQITPASDNALGGSDVLAITASANVYTPPTSAVVVLSGGFSAACSVTSATTASTLTVTLSGGTNSCALPIGGVGVVTVSDTMSAAVLLPAAFDPVRETYTIASSTADPPPTLVGGWDTGKVTNMDQACYGNPTACCDPGTWTDDNTNYRFNAYCSGVFATADTCALTLNAGATADTGSATCTAVYCTRSANSLATAPVCAGLSAVALLANFAEAAHCQTAPGCDWDGTASCIDVCAVDRAGWIALPDPFTCESIGVGVNTPCVALDGAYVGAGVLEGVDTLNASESDVPDGQYNGWTIHTTGGTGLGQTQVIVTYTATTKVFTPAFLVDDAGDTTYKLSPPPRHEYVVVSATATR